MNKRIKNILKYFFLTVLILLIFFLVSLLLDNVLGSKELLPSIFVLGVFVVSTLTPGYYYGLFSALLSVLAVNYAFTFPYFAFNFQIHENIISAIILICVTTATSALSTKIREYEKSKLFAEKEKMRADLLRAISHDLRTPLTTIYGSTSTMLENYEVLPEDRKLDILNGIKNDCRWLVRMVENLLTITRIDNPNIKLLKSSVVLEELVASVIEKFNKNYSHQNVQVEIPPQFITIMADAILVEQVLLNLLENSVLHADGMTELILSAHIKENKVIFEVSDNGCGIEKDKLKNIFSGRNMPESNDLQDNRKKCMGIGLSTCEAIIRAHGGKISAESRKGGGVTFKFDLELEDVFYEQQV